MQHDLARHFTHFRAQHGLLLSVQCVALYLVGRATPFEWGFPLDDAWIHQVVARELARSGHLGYGPEHFASGSTSVLWSLVQAWNHLLFSAPPALYSFAINALLFVATGQLVLRMLRRDGFCGREAFGFAVFATLSGNLVWFVYSGMEATLFLFLSVATIACWLHPGRTHLRTAVATGVLLGMLFLTRPEAGLLGAVLVLFTRAARRRIADVAWLSLPFAAMVASYLAATRLSAGRAGPSTLEGRRWLWTQIEQGADPLQLIGHLLLSWVGRLAEYTLGSESPLFFWVFVGLVLLGVSACIERRASRAGLLTLFALVHLATYAVLMPAEGHGGRYQPLLPMLFLPLGWLGLSTLLDRGIREPRTLAIATTAASLLLVIPVLLCLNHWGTAHRLAVMHVRDTEIRMGERLRGLPEDARIASFDIGAIGYFSERELLDLGGLVDPSVLDVIREGRLWEYLQERRIDHLVLPIGYDAAFPDLWNFWSRLGLDHGAPGEVTLVHRLSSPPEIWQPGVRATLHSSPQQFLFRIDYANEGADAPGYAAAEGDG